MDGLDDRGPVTLDRAIAQRLQEHDAVGKVAVNGSDRRLGALGHHGRGQAIEADLVDDLRRRIEERVNACGASLLDRFRSDERNPWLIWTSHEIIDGH
jgi:hypothetical protein